ncbi:lysine-specific demethylase 8 [Chrysochromulina tobinii]|uniref:Lysine-specific demethylase 8 n=1 Tax=Chrysochromulina tobinii TaxID=1460289 RepID=A0A0M0JBT2_9EUKA|nr:lysine-specific demethylase 8 [Chrysochromulina tobinii]|eukprot:KOO24024.1 lysine-specific demethylase 8 [Chrysochromulina sp. CCMP291]
MASEPGTEGHAAAGKATAEAAGEAAEDAQARHPHAVSSARAVVGYLAQHNLFEQIPRLRRDFAIPALLAGGVQHMHAWLGPEGTVTPLHFDSYDNVLVQVVGHKLVSLFDSGQTPRLYPKEGGGTGVDAQGNVSAVDVEAPDMGRFPEFAHAVGYECVLGPGEGLYIPAGCWHHVRSLSPSWSISFWF